MLLTKASEYAIRAILELARLGETGYTPVRVLAERTQVSAFYLSKLCHQLTQAGILHSHKGPQGGVRLARSPRQITLLDIVEAIEGKDSLEGCVLGLEPCGDEQPCPVHHRWAPVKKAIYQMLTAKTVHELVEDLKSGQTTLQPTALSKRQ